MINTETRPVSTDCTRDKSRQNETSFSQRLDIKINKLLNSGWRWNFVDGIGEVLESPNRSDIFPMYRISTGKLVPTFLK